MSSEQVQPDPSPVVPQLCGLNCTGGGSCAGDFTGTEGFGGAGGISGTGGAGGFSEARLLHAF